jgi:hypothetical protein
MADMKVSKISGSLTSIQKACIYWIISLFYIIFFSISSSLIPGDIPGGRESFKQNNPSDFLGTYAGFVYFLIPEWPLGWARNLTLIQLTLTLIGLSFLIPIRNLSRYFSFWKLLIVHYLVAVFSSQQSRDGALFSQIILGLGILNLATTKKRFRGALTCLGVLIIVSGLSFRPIMSISGLILFLFFQSVVNQEKKVMKKSTAIGISLTIIFTPTSVELGMTHLLVQQSKYPLQTVVLQDLGFAACQSGNPETINRSIRALSAVATDDFFDDRICQFFRIYTWQSLVGIIAPSQITNGLESPLREVTSSREFSALLEDWASLMLSDPKTYVQAKLTSLVQVLFSSQTKIWGPTKKSQNLGLLDNVEQSIQNIAYVAYLPWILLSEFYLISPLVVLLICLLVNSMLRQKVMFRPPGLRLIPLMVVLAIIVNAVLFVSDNARYTTSFLVLAFVCYALAFAHERQDN